MKEPVTIAGIQFQGQLGCVEENTAHALELVAEAAAAGAKIICLPELFSTGYNLRVLGDRFKDLAQPTGGSTITALCRAAKTHGVYLIAPIALEKTMPGVARILTLQGAEMLFCPSAWCYPDLDLWHVNMPCRALENSVYLMAVNRVGQEEHDLRLAGSSLVCDPRGRIIRQLDTEHEGILYAQVDRNKVIAQRSELLYLRDRCPGEYLTLTAPHIS